jgi:hypothetical protein
LNGLEALEVRQFLSAAPVHAIDVAVFAAPIQPADATVRPVPVAEVRQIEAVAPVREDHTAQPFIPAQPFIAAQPFVPAQPHEDAALRGEGAVFETIGSPDTVRVKQIETLRYADPLPPILVIHFDPGAANLAGSASLRSNSTESPSGPAGFLLNRGALFGQTAFGPGSSGLVLTPSSLSPNGGATVGRGPDPAFGRYWSVLFDGWQQTYFGDVSGMNGAPVDPHVRFLNLAHDPLGEARSMLSSPDTEHTKTSDVLTTEGDRRVTSALTALFGQSAETDTVLVGRGRVLGDNHYKTGEGAQANELATEPVGYLVAFDTMALGLGLGAVSAAGQPQVVGQTAFSFLLEDLITPSFSYDTAALSIAINDLVDQADEMGGGLLGMLGDSATSGEAALVAGLVGAGLAYRHWRGGQRRKLSEDRELLSARFLRGPASLRLHRRITA